MNQAVNGLRSSKTYPSLYAPPSSYESLNSYMPSVDYGVSNQGGSGLGMSFGGGAIGTIGTIGSGVAGTISPQGPMGFLDQLKAMPWFDSTNDKTGLASKGIASTGIAGAQALMGAYLGMKNYGLAKKTFSENKRQYDQNYDAQRTTLNADMQDRQNARNSASPGYHQSTEEYMKKNRIA